MVVGRVVVPSLMRPTPRAAPLSKETQSSYNCRKRLLADDSSICGSPNSTTRPACNTATRSKSTMVLSRWAMEMIVHCLKQSRMIACIIESVRMSTLITLCQPGKADNGPPRWSCGKTYLELTSSSMTTVLFLNMLRARQNNCLWP